MGASVALGITLEEFSSLPGDGAQHEVSAGQLITIPPPKFSHAKVSLAMLEALQAYLRGKQWKAIPEAGYVLCPDPLTIRQPDISVLSKERFDTTQDEEYCEGAPELAIEVMSPSNHAEDIELKVAQYLQYGAMQVWMLYPKTRRVHVFAAGGSTILTATQVLDGGTVLPGFSVPVSDLFAV